LGAVEVEELKNKKGGKTKRKFKLGTKKKKSCLTNVDK